MLIKEVKENLNKPVIYKNSKSDYILSGCTIRKDKNNNFYYQAEILDAVSKNSVIICGLDDVTVRNN